MTENIDSYLNDTFYSVYNDNREIMIDRNIDTGERYKNIFELRLIKNKYLIEKMPKLVKNYCLITYDELIHNFVNTMNKIQKFGLKIKDNIDFPINITYFKKNKTTNFIKKPNVITKDKIIIENEELKYYERLLFPNKLTF